MTIPTPSNEDAARLGRYIEARRRERGLSMRALARAAGFDIAHLHRLEHGGIGSPDPHVLQGLARALEVDLADLYIEAGLPLPKKLPSMKPYLRATSDLPEEAIDQIAEYAELLAERYSEGKEGGHDDAAKTP